MIGAIIGDIAGSIYEFNNIKTKDFPLFNDECEITDDSLMSIAVAGALLRMKEEGADLQAALVSEMQLVGKMYPYPMGGYGGRFAGWLTSPSPAPYNSLGNGSAMRVSPCGDMASTMDEAIQLATESAAVTHNHPEGIKGAQAVAAAIFLAKTGADKAAIREHINSKYYPLTQTVDEIRKTYRFDETCMGTVPQAIIAFLESTSFEDALRNAVSLGGDSDTLTDITCAIAWPFYARQGVDATMEALRDDAFRKIPDEMRGFVEEWENEYGV